MFANQIEFLQLLNGTVQYVVPRWQRRYRWGQSEIERLIEDLVTVAAAGPESGHYGGTMLTFSEPGPAGIVKTYRVVDGQQRLTTISILLACIAESLGAQGVCGDWTAQIIKDDRLTNPGKPQDRLHKLRLQKGDDEEYRDVLAGKSTGAGAVTQAWRTIRRLVARNDIAILLRGLERFRVVSIGLDGNEDPQQIFESLNATGRPLTESEKVKNWLLMGLPETLQHELHDVCWTDIEKALGGQHTTEPIDIFLRDLLRWRTGVIQGMDRVYEGLRRWAVRQQGTVDRPKLCYELARLAKLYGVLTGTADNHSNQKVERELRHLRAMGIDVHRPFTLRLLDDAEKTDETKFSDNDLAQTLRYIGTWITRLWLADRPTAGLNKAIAEIAHGPGPPKGENYAEYWLGRIQRLSNTRTGVPSDDEVIEGISSRRAYGGGTTPVTFAVLCAIMEAEHREQAPARNHLTVEHIMPQKLTTVWRHELGQDADEVHEQYCNLMANLTLSGDITNAEMGAKSFKTKAKAYEESTIGMTRRLADESTWNEEALERRSDQLATRILSIWSWKSHETKIRTGTPLKWRIDEGDWHLENTASGMVLNVAGMLVAMDPKNPQRLSGNVLTRDVFNSSSIPIDSKASAIRFRAVTGSEDLFIYPYTENYSVAAKRCQDMGQRCGVKVEVEIKSDNRHMLFWRFLKEQTGGVPGQKDNWRGPSQWTSPLNTEGDRISIYVGNPDLLWLYVKGGSSGDSSERPNRMRRYSYLIQQFMSDQDLADNLQKNSEQGWTIEIQRSWIRDDRDEWPEAAHWIKEQQERLSDILMNH